VNRYRLARSCFEITSILILLLLIPAGCAPFKKKSVSFPGAGFSGQNAGTLIENLENANRTLVSCKGLGRMRYVHSGRLQRLRIAWISNVSEKLRVAVLGPDGRPLLTVSMDGTWFYALDHTTGEFHKDPLDGYRMKMALKLPFDVQSFALILAGRIPVFDYDRIQIADGRKPGETAVILRKWRNRVAKIYISKAPGAVSGPAITGIESYRQTGERRYRVDIKEVQRIKAYVVPRSLTVNYGTDDSFALDIDRYWVNEPVSPSTFVLQPPEKG